MCHVLPGGLPCLLVRLNCVSRMGPTVLLPRLDVDLNNCTHLAMLDDCTQPRLPGSSSVVVTSNRFLALCRLEFRFDLVSGPLRRVLQPWPGLGPSTCMHDFGARAVFQVPSRSVSMHDMRE
jgi:hypothetical protein